MAGEINSLACIPQSIRILRRADGLPILMKIINLIKIKKKESTRIVHIDLFSYVLPIEKSDV